MSLPSVPAAKLRLDRKPRPETGMLKAALLLQQVHCPQRRARPTGMLKLQDDASLLLNRCPGCGVCYKNENRVSLTRPTSVTGRCNQAPKLYFHASFKFLQVRDLAAPDKAYPPICTMVRDAGMNPGSPM